MKEGVLNKKNQFYVVLILSVIVLAVQWFLFRDIKTSGTWERLAFSFFLFFLLPAGVIKFYFKKKLSDFHLSLDFNFREVLVALIGGALLIGLISLLVIKLSWYEKFPISIFFLGSKNVFFLIYFTIFPLIIFLKQFFFFGFFLRSAEKALGVWKGCLIMMIFVVLDYLVAGSFSPYVLFLTILVNMFLVWLVFRTRTIVLTFLVSWLVGMVIDFTILYQINLVR